MSRTRLLPAAALAAALVLTGCGGDPEPQIADPTASTSDEPSPTADSRATEEDFVRDYIELISESLSTGDPDPWIDLSRDCGQNCETIARNLRDAYSKGGQILGGRWTVSDLEYLSANELGEIWQVEVDTAREQWVDERGDVTRIVRAGVITYELAVTESSEGSLAVNGLRIPA